MGEYEDRYPDAYRHGEETEPEAEHRRYLGVRLPRQVRDGHPAAVERPRGSETPARPAPQPRIVEHVRQAPVARTPREICDDIYEQLKDSPFIDASGIAISVDGSEVTLDGTINSLIAIALARALVTNIPGVSRVQVQLRVQPHRVVI